VGERDQLEDHQAVRRSSRGCGRGVIAVEQGGRPLGLAGNRDVRLQFPDADRYKSLLIFNIRQNYYRLIVKVDYRARLLMVKEFLTHKEYMRGGWKKWAR
jgi:hypothetical protein